MFCCLFFVVFLFSCLALFFVVGCFCPFRLEEVRVFKADSGFTGVISQKWATEHGGIQSNIRKNLCSRLTPYTNQFLAMHPLNSLGFLFGARCALKSRHFCCFVVPLYPKIAHSNPLRSIPHEHHSGAAEGSGGVIPQSTFTLDLKTSWTLRPRDTFQATLLQAARKGWEPIWLSGSDVWFIA